MSAELVLGLVVGFALAGVVFMAVTGGRRI